MSSAGRKLLSAIVDKQDMDVLIQGGVSPEMFKDSEKVLLDFIVGHLNSYGVVPSRDTVEHKLGDCVVEAPEPCKYYLEEVESRYVQSELKRMMIDAQPLLAEEKPYDAFNMMLDRISDLNMHKKRKSLVDFRHIADMVHEAYVKQKAMEDGTFLPLGWESFDGFSGGLRAGDVCSVVGRPASGKTFLTLYSAHKSWKKGHKPLVVSMEMTNLVIGQRLASMDASKPLTQLLKGVLTSSAYKSLYSTLEENKKAEFPFWMVDGNLTATVDDIILLCRQLQPSSVFIDGAYLLRHPNPKVSRWDKLTDNAEWIKQRIATDLGIPVVCSYQFSREVTKKKKKDGEKAGLEDIYGSDAIGQLSSLVLGLMEEETVETQYRRKVDILKGRNGETGSFLINWDFHKMDFSEIKSKKDENGNPVEDTEEMKFL